MVLYSWTSAICWEESCLFGTSFALCDGKLADNYIYHTSRDDSRVVAGVAGVARGTTGYRGDCRTRLLSRTNLKRKSSSMQRAVPLRECFQYG